MDDAGYRGWLDRARAHRAEGSPVEAIAWYRRAIRARPRDVEPRLAIGEVLWQLGRPDDAIAAWQAAADLAPAALAPWQALFEARLALGDPSAARAAAQAALRAAPDNARARAFDAVSALLLASASEATQRDDAERVVAEAIAQDSRILSMPAFATALARAVDAFALPAVCQRLVAESLDPQRAGALPMELLAPACEHAVRSGDPLAADALLDAAADRASSAADREPLRRCARIAIQRGHSKAARLANAYASACIEPVGFGAPLTWPLRAAGERARVVALVGKAPGASAFAWIEEWSRAPGVDLVLARAGGGSPADVDAASERVRALPTLALQDDPGLDDAKRVAALDPDLLVDLAGLDASVGRLLAWRPARRVVAVAGIGVTSPPPLVDEVLDPSAPAPRGVAGAGATHPVGAAALSRMRHEALLAHQSGDLALARRRYAELLAVQPGCAAVLYLDGIAARDGGDRATARERLTAAIAAAPRYVDAIVAAARLATDDGDPRSARETCERALRDGVVAAPLLRALGYACLRDRAAAAAASAFEQALALEPFDAETRYNLGVALQTMHRPQDAVRAYQLALFERPDLTAAGFNLGVALQEQRAWAAAAAAYEAVLRAEPSHVAAYRNLGEVQFADGRIDAWLANFDRFEAQCPDSLPLAVMALEVCQWRGDFDRLEHYLEGLRNERFKAADETELLDALEQLLYLLLFFDVEPDLIHKFATTYDASMRKLYGEPLPRPLARRAGRTRIGFLSADLRNHVMGKMMFSAIEPIDRERFELFFYSLSAEDDAWTARFRALGRFVTIAAEEDRAAAQRIAADDLDILFDLSTHTKGARPGILVLKPARVQITHVASAGTVGLSAVDFKLTDRYADVPENAQHQIEKLLPMDGCVYPWRPIEPAGTRLFERGPLGLPDDAFVIGAFVTGMKLSRRCLRLWREVLERVPRARIAFSPVHPALAPLFRRIAAAGGIDAARIVVLPQGRDEAENQDRYRIVDVVLDPVPYGGANGTLEAIAMGVPVVTLVGRKHCERTSYSMLSNLGVEETIARTGRDYVDIAVRLATDAGFADAVRAKMRDGLSHSPLTDRAAHARALERACLQALEWAASAGGVEPSP